MKLASLRLMSLAIVLLLFISGIFNRSYSQLVNPSTAKLKWNISHASNLNKANDTFPFICEFITEGANNISWIQHGAAGTSEFKVNSISGDWSDITKTGELIFFVSQDDLKGTIKVKRASDNAIDLQMDMGTESKYVFRVKNYTILN